MATRSTPTATRGPGPTAAAEAVAARAPAWAATPPAERRQILGEVLCDVPAAAEDWLADAVAHKGLAFGSPEAGEELFAGLLTFLRVVRLLRDALGDIEACGRPRYPKPPAARLGDRVAVEVFPLSPYDRLAFARTTAEVWFHPAVDEEELQARQAAAYRDPARWQGTCLVLAAGNVASLGPRDVLHKLFVEGKTVVLKANPVNDYLVPHWERALGALIERGFLAIVRGGPEVGAELVAHPAIDEVHITGSAATHDAIVFGPGEEGARRKAAGEPRLHKPITSELGNVSPVIVVPGPWSSSDLLYQARHLATMVVNNGGFNCLTPRVLITHAGWEQRPALLEALAQTLRSLPTRRPYYPGAEARRAAFIERHPEAWLLDGHPAEGHAPWTLICDVPPGRTDDVCFTTEAFCGLVAETALEASSPDRFVDAAVEFANTTLWGTLSATVIAKPTSLDLATRSAVERALAELRYGAIGYNLWHAHAFALGSPTWGAYPGHRLEDIQSGRGVVGNTFMFSEPEKSVVAGPFRSFPEPPWFATSPRQLPVARAMVSMEARPSPAALARVLKAAAFG